MKETKWIRLLAYMTGLVNQELLLQNEYLAAENRVLRAHLHTRLRLSDPERSALAEIGKRLGRKALAQVACVAKPDTIWLGTGGLSPGSSMAPNTAATPAGRESNRNWKCLLCRWPKRMPVGATTGSWARWPISVMKFPTRRWGMF